ncbi:MAG: GIY-YIG nuclease family protein, partial [Prevotella sp.]|nr:GIY-YIG nuclease family protein [Prevotella sp.]
MKKEENEQRLQRLKNIVLNLPDKPGSYQYYDQEGVIIYVGKAKNLKARVSSYFHKEVDRYKTKVLVSKIWDITYTVVNTEEDALLLENALIKKYQPKYNILLKDGKTYPSICITKEYLPRIFKTRVINKKSGYYFGPYSHIGTMYSLLDIIKTLYKPRTCRFPITKEGIEQKKYKPCLEYHIHNCMGPCIGKQSYEDYISNINQAKEILKGHSRDVQKLLFEMMQKAAEELRFEDAEELKRKYLALESFVSKSEVVSYTINNVDVFTISQDEKTAFVNYMHVTNGTTDQAFTYEIKKKLEEDAAEILSLAIIQIREQVKSEAK